jgi:hypothetical protein
VKKKNVENLAYDEIITNVIQGKHTESKEYKEKGMKIINIVENVRIETPKQMTSTEEKNKCQSDKM